MTSSRGSTPSAIILLIALIVVASSSAIQDDTNNAPKCQFGKSPRKQIDVTALDGMCLRDMVVHLSKHLYTLGEDELGVGKFQGILDRLVFVDLVTTISARLNDLAKSLNDKLKKYTDLLRESNSVVQPILLKQGQDVYLSFGRKTDTASGKPSDTCSKIIDALAMNVRNQDWKNLHILPVSQPGTMCGPPSLAHNIGPLLLSQCNRSKNIILLLEQNAGFMSEEDETLAQITAKTIVHMLSETDRVTVIGLAAGGGGLCLDQGLPRATDIHKIRLDRHIDSLVRSSANQSFGLDVGKIVRNVEGELVLVHLTNNLNAGLHSDVNRIAEAIKNERLVVHLRTILILSNQQLQQTSFKEHSNNGSVITLPTQHVLGYEIARLFAGLKCAKEDAKPYYLSDPYFEPYSKAMMLSIGQITNTALLSFDVKLRDFVEDVTYFEVGSQQVHAILLDKRGVIWMHKNFPRMETIIEQPLKVYLHQIENLDEDIVASTRMAQESEGVVQVKTLLGTEKRLYWRQLDYSELIVCLVVSGPHLLSRHRPVTPSTTSPDKNKPPKQPTIEEVSLRLGLVRPDGALNAGMLHHRLDLALGTGQLRRDSLCAHAGNRRVASHEAGVLFLSGWCFRSAAEQARQLGLAARVTVQSYMAYLRDETRLLANPGLRDDVKPELKTLGRLLELFRERRATEGPLERFVVQRYGVAVGSGALVLHPGLVLDAELDPKRRAWYVRGLEQPDRLVLGPPYLDAGGAGYVVTLSRLVHEGRSVGLHSSSDPAFAVLGLDLTLGYFGRMLEQLFPLCGRSDGVKCFLMDDKGYLVYHPALMKPGAKVEQQHLTNKEFLVANDILNHENFVNKRMCASHMDGTGQRYYQFNVSLDEVLTNIVHGEHCVLYQLAAVPGTNLFLGVVNVTCSSSNAFCPCSTTDRSCLNCIRMEQMDCECPCECSLYTSECQSREAPDTKLEVCPAPHEQGSAGLSAPWIQSGSTSALRPCQAFSCRSLPTRSDCLGVVGCQWCELDSDAETTLDQPYCADLALCFRGVLGASIPYGDGSYDSQASEEMLANDWPGVGSVAGVILGLLLAVGLALFCHRLRNVHTGLEHQCLHNHNSPDTLRMTHLDCELEPTDHEPKPSMDSALLRDCAAVAAVPVVSPYRVSSGYRRAPQADSDHGYSTMTPHDDSEQHNFSEPLLVLANGPNDGPVPTTASVTALESPATSSSTIVPSPTTNIASSPHRVIAAVTVHRNMETNYC
ncbi:VWFA and cache domain-containing protein 1 [Copidosoma floridanum]|uniref:VWFA and cache domain-containing protein 1 n=1 Tax=Copidosoma floridanum TaxID=29053 RepID=UPI0006C9E3FA|nr:VWFA and cache domain-containing protein 1 [Copidosoma floridanum]